MGKLVSESDYQDIFGNCQKKEYERVEYISNIKPIVINTKIFTTEATKFEIKLALKGHDPVLMMGCYDFTKGRKAALFNASNNSLMYNFPEDKEQKYGRCIWAISKPAGYYGDFPHVIEFGNNYIKDNTSNRKGGLAPEDYYPSASGIEDPRVNNFSTNAPFGLFGIIEFKGENLPLNYIIPKSDIYSIYYFKVFEKNQLIADMIPAKDESGILCMYDLVRNDFFYPLNDKGQVVSLLNEEEGIIEDKEEKPDKGIIRGIMQSLKYAIKREWNPKYHGGRLEIIKRHGKYKVIAYSTTDNDKKVVWNSSDRSVQRASWEGSVIELYCGLGHSIMLYGPNNFDEQ